MNVQNIRVKWNEYYYPDELQNLSISNGSYAMMYEQFSDYDKVFFLIKRYIFKKCIFNRYIGTVFDVTLQNDNIFDRKGHPENISDSKSNIVTNIDFEKPVFQTYNILAHVAVASEKFLSFDTDGNEIREV